MTGELAHGDTLAGRLAAAGHDDHLRPCEENHISLGQVQVHRNRTLDIQVPP
jgi:hypothetical protein